MSTRVNLKLRFILYTTLAVVLAVGAILSSKVSASYSDSLAQDVPSAVAAVPTVLDDGNIQKVNWFSDWQTCIWGIGVPSAWAWRNPAKAKQAVWNLVFGRGIYGGAAALYGHHVVSACARFIRS